MMNSTERVGRRRSAGGLFGLDGERRAHLLLHMSAIVSAHEGNLFCRRSHGVSPARVCSDTFSRKLLVKTVGPPTHKSPNPAFRMEKMPETRFGGDICVTPVIVASSTICLWTRHKNGERKGIFVVVLGDGSGTEGTQMGASNTRLPVPSNLT